MEHGRFKYSPITHRDTVSFPKKARIAVCISPNIEHFVWNKPAMSCTPLTVNFQPDVLNSSWRDYGARVGFWRVLDILNNHGIRASAPVNSDVCEFYPEIIEAGSAAGWEWIAHGPNNSMMFTGMDEDTERGIIVQCLDQIEKAVGARPKGWLGPVLTETDNTLDILKQAGVEYVCDWGNDELPYDMKTKHGDIVAMPYSIEVGDIPVILQNGGTGEDFYRVLVDQFDQLYEEGASKPRVMSVSLHPFLIGHPFRARWLNKALEHMLSHNDVWLPTGSELLEWYKNKA